MNENPRQRNFGSRSLWLVIVLACLVPAALNSFSAFGSAVLGKGKIDWVQVIFRGAFWLFFGAVTPVPYFMARRFPLRRENLWRTLLIHSAGALLLCFVWTSLSVLLALLISQRMSQEPVLSYYFTWMLINLPWAVFLYFTFIGSLYAFTYYDEAREHQAQEARLATQLAEARLAALRMQLNPHFLFNSLNAITVLVRDQQSEQASQMLELLSDFLRHVLRSKSHSKIPLDEELAFLEKYLAIEQVRFADRLKVKWNIEAKTREALVPEFILQPLVENSLLHGIQHRTENGVIEVVAKESNGEIVLIVQDNGPGYFPVTDEGLGLANTRERLTTIYGDAGKLDVATVSNGGTIVTVRFPLTNRSTCSKSKPFIGIVICMLLLMNLNSAFAPLTAFELPAAEYDLPRTIANIRMRRPRYQRS
jgi:two-component system, LytTR family, sensor kinase